jgi:hypothetical protein
VFGDTGSNLDDVSYTLTEGSCDYPLSFQANSVIKVKVKVKVKMKLKVKLSLCLTMTMPRRRIGEWRYISTHFLTSTLDGDEWSASRTGRFTPRERVPGTHWIGGWVGPRAVLDAVLKRKIPSPHRKSNPDHRIVQPVASRYTD